MLHVHTRKLGSLGTLSRRELHRRVHLGEVCPDDIFWLPGMAQWEEVQQHPDLFADLAPIRTPPSPLSDGMETLSQPDGSPGSAGHSHAPLDTGAPQTFPTLQPPKTTTAASDEEDRLDAVFSDLLHGTFAYRDTLEFARSIDEVFLGAVIAAALDAGRILSELTSDGTHHFLELHTPNHPSRIQLRLTHLTGSVASSMAQGHVASLVVSYGERLPGFSDIWTRWSRMPDRGFVTRDSPGTITIEADVTTRFIYARVPLFLRIDDYIDDDWSVDQPRLVDHLTACTRALRQHLHASAEKGSPSDEEAPLPDPDFAPASVGDPPHPPRRAPSVHPPAHSGPPAHAVGAFIRAMASLGHSTIRFDMKPNQQTVRFRIVHRSDLTTLTLIIGSQSGASRSTSASLPSQVGIQVVGELRECHTHPSTLRPSLQPTRGSADGIQVEREWSSLLASTTLTVNLAAQLQAATPSTTPLQALMEDTLDRLARAVAAARGASASENGPLSSW